VAALTPTRASAVSLPRTAPASAWRGSIRFGLGAVVAFRLVSEAAVLAGLYGAAALRVVSSDPGALARPWQQWDAHWQVAIAQSGFLPWSHIVQGPHVLSSAAFQPVLPGLMHVTAMATGLPALAAGLLIVTIALAAAAVGLHRLVQVDYGAGAARFAVVLLLIVPTAVFLGAPYAEPLVLAEVIWAFLAMRSGRPLVAGVLVGLAAMTKLYAITFALPLAVEALAVTAPAWRPRLAVLARVAVGPALGVIGLALFYGLVFRDPLRFLGAQQDWAGRHFAPPWVAVGRALDPAPTFSFDGAASALDLTCVLVLVAATGYAWKRLRRSYAVLLGVQLLVFTSTTALVGTSRWTLDAFPVFIAGGVLAAGRRRLRLAMVTGLIPAAGLFLWIYSHGGWVS
jgi:hypothetical protein